MALKLKKIIKMIILFIIDKPFSLPTKTEIDLVDKYKKKFQNINISSYHLSTDWDKHLKKIMEHIKTDDFRSFLRWPLIQDTMFITYNNYIILEFIYLVRLKNWKKKWRNAIIENSVGNPIPFMFYRKTSSNLIHHAYHLARFQTIVDIKYSELKFIFEFGGGYGSMCRLFRNLGFQDKYLIYDLPHFSLLQEYYLLSVQKNKNHNENNNLFNNVYFQSNIDDLVLNMTSAPNFDIEKSLFIASWSLSEAPIKIRENIESIISCFKYILITYQHSHSGFDNLYYFNNLVSKFDQYEWIDRKIKHLEGNSYLFGYRK